MIATLGGLAILMLYMAAVSTFLLSGLSLFAPYVANMISTAIQPNIRKASRGDAAPSAPAQPTMANAPDPRLGLHHPQWSPRATGPNH